LIKKSFEKHIMQVMVHSYEKGKFIGSKGV
jgi:predicted RNA-binding protein YlqC (UPF0109 family)